MNTSSVIKYESIYGNDIHQLQDSTNVGSETVRKLTASEMLYFFTEKEEKSEANKNITMLNFEGDTRRCVLYILF